MNELLATYLQNNVSGIYIKPSTFPIDALEDLWLDESYPIFEPIVHEPSVVYDLGLEIDCASTSNYEMLKDLENAFRMNYKSLLRRTIELSDFVDGESNEAYELFDKMLSENVTVSMAILQELYWEQAKDDNVIFLSKLLNILAYCPFEQVKEMGLCIFASAITNKNARIKSMALRVAGHWANPELLKYLDKMDIVDSMWLKKKCESVKKSIRLKWSI